VDFAWTAKEQAFRQEIRDFLRKELPSDWLQRAGDDDESARDEFERGFAQKLGERGWLTCAWPKEYGGLGWSPMEQMIFNEEMALHKAPRKYMGNAISLAGPVIMIHGTEEQKRRHLPKIARAEVIWCQLFSEPNAGSDLASLQTFAEDKGDYFQLNGQKVWTSQGMESHWGILLARTDKDLPKHKGISYFLLDLALPGITRRPIVNMADVVHFGEFFFDNVRVPRDCLVGEKNKGWYLATTTLNFERSGIKVTVPAMQLFDEVLGLAKTGINGYRPIEHNPALRMKLADMAIQLQTSRMLSYKVGWMQNAGKIPSYESSIARLFATELTQRLTQLCMEVLGHWGELTHESRLTALRGKVQKLYRGQRAITIGSGTSEIQRNTIAMRGLGLPRG